MARTYSQDQGQNGEEGAAQKTDGRAIPFTGIVLFVALALIVGLFAWFRNRGSREVQTPTEVQSAAGNPANPGNFGNTAAGGRSK